MATGGAADEALMGYAGCSNSRDNVNGVHLVAPGSAWWQPYDTGGQDLREWSQSTSQAWARFDEQVAAQGVPDRVWFQLCGGTTQGNTQETINKWVTQAVGHLRQRIGTRPLFLSPVEDSVTCPKGDATRMNLAADLMVSQGKAEKGPILSPLVAGELADNCHPNAAGQRKHGVELLGHFGAVLVGIDDQTLDEGASASSPMTFTVSLSKASSSTVSVLYASGDGTANAGSDYTAVAGSLSFAPGETSKTITMAALDDGVEEPEESFTVDLSNPSGAILADASGTGTITDDGTAPGPTLSIDDRSIQELSAGTRSLNFAVNLSAASATPITVAFATANGTASAPSDYVSRSGTLTFSPGQVTKSVNVKVNGDTLDEPDEVFTVILSDAAGASLADGSGTGTIADDDGPPPGPTLSIDDRTIQESASTQSMIFTVTLSGASSTAVTVTFTTANGTATAPSDYVGRTGAITFDVPGQLTKTISVKVKGDAVAEPDEAFTVILTNPSGATLSDGSGTGTITDDDAGAPAAG